MVATMAAAPAEETTVVTTVETTVETMEAKTTVEALEVLLPVPPALLLSLQVLEAKEASAEPPQALLPQLQ